MLEKKMVKNIKNNELRLNDNSNPLNIINICNDEIINKIKKNKK